MTTLNAIGFTIVGGSTVLAGSLCLFAWAQTAHATQIAPRATARPAQVIYSDSTTKEDTNNKTRRRSAFCRSCRRRRRPYSAVSTTGSSSPSSSSSTASSSSAAAAAATSEQQSLLHSSSSSSSTRGNPYFGWIGWTLGLSYDTLLKGVPGTGTREHGHDGPLLKVTLDGIVLLRFLSLGRKVTALATLLCVAFLMPLYWSSPCLQEKAVPFNATSTSWDDDLVNQYKIDDDFVERYECDPKGVGVLNLTDYGQTTLANVPALGPDSRSHLLSYTAIMLRLYGMVAVMWALTLFTCLLLRNEWMDLLALRRVYYLEKDVWGERLDAAGKNTKHGHQTNNNDTISSPTIQSILRSKDNLNGKATSRGSLSSRNSNKVSISEDPTTTDLQRVESSDVVLSQSASETDDQQEDDEQLLRHALEPWIPDPKYPDTVANVELYSLLVGNLPQLPEQVGEDVNPQETLAASKRDNIDWQLALTTQFFDHCVPNQPGFSSSVAAVTILPGASELARAWHKWYTAAARLRRLRFIRKQITHRRGRESFFINNHEQREVISEGGDIEMATVGIPSSGNGDNTASNSQQQNANKNQQYLHQVLGPIVADEADNKIYESITFGPEQTAAYTREFAQAASPCCPNGFCEGWVTGASLDRLLDMEEVAAIQVHQAITELQDARCHISPTTERTVVPSATTPSTTLSKGQERVPRQQPSSLFTASAKSIDLREWTMSHHSDFKGVSAWERVQDIIRETRNIEDLPERPISSGVWGWPKCPSHKGRIRFDCPRIRSRRPVDDLMRESTFAVVTFTSRQAAVAARHCLADGRGVGRWMTLKDTPIPPLADAAACNLLLCRNCCRPVTVSINERQKTIRHYFTLALLFTIYVFYTIPLYFASSLVDPTMLETMFGYVSSDALHLISGFLVAMIWSLFFMVCPQLFKTIANIGSGANSVALAERRALQYFWWFMVITAFTGSMLARWFIGALHDGYHFGSGFRVVVRLIAGQASTIISANWLNWILYRCFCILPLNYMLQINTFIFDILGLKCLSRATIGGGPGGPIPYRIYVDSGVVLMCTFALGPAAPLVTPAALFYFIICEPIFRRNLIFVYRPRYDDGGLRWSFLFDMVISSLILGQLMIAVQMAMKNAFGPMVLSTLAVPATIFFQWYCKRKFGAAFHDAALLQTALLDGWDTAVSTCVEEREDYRQFLVDAHKAAYIPVCLAAGTGAYITAEPAVVLPENRYSTDDIELARSHSRGSEDEVSPRQHGASLRRSDPQVQAALQGVHEGDDGPSGILKDEGLSDVQLDKADESSKPSSHPGGIFTRRTVYKKWE